MYFAHFSKLGKKPNFFHLPFVFVLAILDSTYTDGFRSILRAYRSLKLSEVIETTPTELPTIELLCVVAGKDLELLEANIPAAVQNSNNPISRITVITRPYEVLVCTQIMDSLNLKQEISVVNEEKYFSSNEVANLRKKFQNRFGWVLQQLLAVNFVLSSESQGVLLLNADTTMLRKIDWLYLDESQNIYASLEYHKPYYLLLNKLIQSNIYPNWTYITHHMLFQPKYFREIFDTFQIGNMKDLIDWLIQNASDDESSPLCVEFELYGQGMEILHPEMLHHKKFANTSWRRTPENFEKRDLILTGRMESQFNSISMHDYLGR